MPKRSCAHCMVRGKVAADDLDQNATFKAGYMALLTAMNVPLNLLFVILPFYAFIDMVETSINVWSDACVTSAVEKDLNK